MDYIDDIYLSLQGLLTDDEKVPGVENLWVPGSFCDQQYNLMLEASNRLCDRLGAGEEDPDVTAMIDALLRIQQELCRHMFLYGAKFGNTDAKTPCLS